MVSLHPLFHKVASSVCRNIARLLLLMSRDPPPEVILRMLSLRFSDRSSWVRPGLGSVSAGGADAESKSRPRRTGYHHHSANTRSSIDTAVPAVTLSGPDLGQEASILGNHTEHMPQQQQAEQGSSIPWGISSLNYSSESGKSAFLVRVFRESWANLTQKIM
jgi:hypothetical protein